MHCSNCGAAASGNFCGQCGQRLAAPAAPGAEPAPANGPPFDWEQAVDVEALLRQPELRARVERHAAQAGKGMTGEEWAKLYDQLKLMPMPLAPLLPALQQLNARVFGMSTGKTRAETLPRPPGRVLMSLLCAHARRGRAIKSVAAARDGCVVTAALPSDFWSLAGELAVSVQRLPEGTRVEAATTIPGQKYDWGKSRRCLDGLFEDLRIDPS